MKIRVAIFTLLGVFTIYLSAAAEPTLYQQIKSESTKQNWQIVTGGDIAFAIDIKHRKKKQIVLGEASDKYTWSVASLSPDGEYLALQRGARRPPFKNDLVIVRWKKYIKSNGLLNEYSEFPLPEMHVDGFSWAPDKYSLAIKAHNISDTSAADSSKRPFKVYEYSIETKELKELPIPKIAALYPNSWSVDNLLVYKSEDNILDVIDAKRSGGVVQKVSTLSLFDFKTETVATLFDGYFPSWNSNGGLTFVELSKDFGSSPKGLGKPDGNHYFTDQYFTFSRDTGEKVLLMGNKVPRGKGGSVFGPIVWSPDNRYILYGKQVGLTGSFDDLYAMEVATGQEVLICRGVDSLSAGSVSWVSLS